MLANIKIALTANKKGYIMAYEYPKEPHANTKDTTYITNDLFGTDKIIAFTKDASSGFKMVTEKDGVDGNDNQKAILRRYAKEVGGLRPKRRISLVFVQKPRAPT